MTPAEQLPPRRRDPVPRVDPVGRPGGPGTAPDPRRHPGQAPGTAESESTAGSDSTTPKTAGTANASHVESNRAVPAGEVSTPRILMCPVGRPHRTGTAPDQGGRHGQVLAMSDSQAPLAAAAQPPRRLVRECRRCQKQHVSSGAGLPHARGIAASVGGLPAKLTAASVTVCPSGCLAGRSALPLDPGDGGHRGMPRDHQGQAQSQRSRPWNSLPSGPARCRVGWWSACGWGSGMPAPSGQIPPPWARWENEAPTTRAACGPVPGHSK